MNSIPGNRLAPLIKRVCHEFSGNELLGLLAPNSHSSMLARRRVDLIISRIRMMAILFAVLTPLWVVVDVLVFSWPVWFWLSLMRLVASLAFAALAFLSIGRTGITNAYQMLAIMLGIPILFFALSNGFLGGSHSSYGLEEMVATSYKFLPFVMLAGLSVFPLTAIEGLVFSGSILASVVVVGSPQMAEIGQISYWSLLWLLMLISVVVTLAGMSQLGFMMELVRQATRDNLTGCFTRSCGEELLEIQIHTARRNRSHMSVIFIDVDDFKLINDNYGHEAGDKVLSGVAMVMRSSLRQEDMLLRWGGEEFVLLLPGVDWPTARQVVERIRADGFGFRPDGKPVTASFGVAEYQADKATNWQDLVELADRRMYAAKQAGKDRFVGCDDKPVSVAGAMQPV